MTDERKAIVAYLRAEAVRTRNSHEYVSDERANDMEWLATRIEDMHADTVPPPAPASLHATFDCADNQDCDASCPTCKGAFSE